MVKSKDRWSALSMKERAELFKIGIQNGITDRNVIIKMYNSYGSGGRILDGETEDQQTLSNEPIYYDNTPIETPVVKAFNSNEEYNRYYGEQFGRKVAKKRDEVASQVFSGLEYSPIIGDGIEVANALAAAENGDYSQAMLLAGLSILPGNLSKGLKFIKDTKVRRAVKKRGLGKLFDFTDTKMPVKEGSESIVYIGDNEVFKVPSNGSPEMTLEEIQGFNERYAGKRNIPPHTAQLTPVGVIKGSTEGKFYPVYSQQKLNVVGDEYMPIWEWEKHKALLDQQMIDAGWISDGGSYYYNKDLDLHIGDISPMNTAYDANGNMVIIDGDVYKNGGNLLTTKKKY